MAGKDFVQVQLTPAGLDHLGEGHTLRISNGRRTIAFHRGKPTMVERSYEWNGFLATHHTPDGRGLFELAPPEPEAPTTHTAPAKNQTEEPAK